MVSPGTRGKRAERVLRELGFVRGDAVEPDPLEDECRAGERDGPEQVR